ncbi:MAG: hypothetical protein ACRCT8_06780 [Lacipirellulaceae bacterium]
MTTEQFRKIQQAHPFQPFRMRMADGRVFDVPHRDFVALSPTGRTVIVFDIEGAASCLDLLLMTEIEIPSPSSPGAGAA